MSWTMRYKKDRLTELEELGRITKSFLDSMHYHAYKFEDDSEEMKAMNEAHMAVDNMRCVLEDYLIALIPNEEQDPVLEKRVLGAFYGDRKKCSIRKIK